jgi:glutathione synthase
MASSGLDIAIQMDPIDNIDIRADSTFALALEAKARGHRLYHYLASDLALEDGAVRANGRTLDVRDDAADHFSFGPDQMLDLRKVDVVLMRQDPPFHMGYITATHILEHIKDETLVVNDPVEVRNAPEKLFITKFEGLLPPTLISRRRQDIAAFREKHKDIIIKPLFGNGGVGVFHIKEDDENLGALLEMFEAMYPEPFIAQKYLPQVRDGDKRIILVDGEPVGALNRIPKKGEARSNLHVGGQAQAAQLTGREREICRIIGPELKARGQIFVGIDVIGDFLTEINVTSPTGIQEISRYDGTNLAGLIWDAIEARL